MTPRQLAWARAARREAEEGNEVAAALFALLAAPNDQEEAKEAPHDD